MRVSASSVMSSVEEINATPAKWRSGMGGECTIQIVVRRLFITGSVAWAAMLPAATFVASRPQPGAPEYLFAMGVYLVGEAVCHQLDARSFHRFGKQMPVCARCLGIYTGAAIAAVVAWRGRAGRSPRAARLILGAAAVPALASLVFEWWTGIMPSNITRAA